MADIVDVGVYKGTDLFNIKPVVPRTRRGETERMPDIFNLTFHYNSHDRQTLTGGGIYAIYYKGELLYIGIYTGEQRVPFVANVAEERFWKHLEALTLRGRSVGFSVQNYESAVKLAISRPNCPLIRTLKKTCVPRGNGSVKTYPRKVEFASDNWHAFSSIESNSALDDFTFAYGRVGANDFIKSITYQQVKNYLGAIENELLGNLKPRYNEKFSRPNGKYLAVGPARDTWTSFAKTISDQISRPLLVEGPERS